VSAKTTAEKLLIKPETTLWASDPGKARLLGPLPEGVREVRGPGEASTALLFADDEDALRGLLASRTASEFAAPAAAWVAYPKGNRTDINRDTIWAILAEHGMRPVTQVAIDETWSALRFRPLKPGEFQPKPDR
jgi:hypothetical protein